MRQLFYVNSTVPSRAIGIAPEFRYELWRPSLLSARPKGMKKNSFLVWWMFHRLGVFSNNGYSVFTIYDGERLVHRSLVTPGYFRFPFMDKNDFQIGDTFTDPDYRGKGLAAFAVQEITKTLQCRFDKRGQNGRIWYLVEEENTPSIRAVEKCGYELVGYGLKKKRLGLGAIGYYDIAVTKNNF